VTDEELETTAGSADHVSRLNNEMDLERILKNLSDDDQEMLRLRYLAGLAFNEIGKILKISSIAARVRVHRATRRARAVTQTKK
jgi:RNA polymerase sigma-70 factor (ECF subfamily)